MISEFPLFVFTTLGGLGAGLYAAGVVFPVEGKRNNLLMSVVPLVLLGIELDFMAKLAAKALDEWKAGDDAWRDSLAQAQAFLEGHLLRWARSLAEAIEREYGACFYSRFARMAALIAKRDAAVLADLGQLPW